jgi:2-C-methyl-D-erythritol 4-phosphate cytidylyltransferase
MIEKASVILLAGGKGTRMGSTTPKQFLHLSGKAIVLYSLECFLTLPWVHEIIVVAELEYRPLFFDRSPIIRFALPGKERQDSVFSGLQKVDPSISWVCIHDSARPFIDSSLINPLFHEAQIHGAAALGMPLKFTVKQCCHNQQVVKTLNRDLLWEIQTPQIISHPLLKEGYRHCHTHQISVSDDVSIVEHLQKPVKIVRGSYNNIKITTSEDLLFAEYILKGIHVASL